MFALIKKVWLSIEMVWEQYFHITHCMYYTSVRPCWIMIVAPFSATARVALASPPAKVRSKLLQTGCRRISPQRFCFKIVFVKVLAETVG